jgi:hypothetical protein
MPKFSSSWPTIPIHALACAFWNLAFINVRWFWALVKNDSNPFYSLSLLQTILWFYQMFLKLISNKMWKYGRYILSLLFPQNNYSNTYRLLSFINQSTQMATMPIPAYCFFLKKKYKKNLLCISMQVDPLYLKTSLCYFQILSNARSTQNYSKTWVCSQEMAKSIPTNFRLDFTSKYPSLLYLFMPLLCKHLHHAQLKS